jgi:threonine/homoserine/homoserine lactone efflux protein
VFQWVNPKAWLLALAASAVFVQPERGPVLPQLLVIVAVFFLVSVPSSLLWAALGSNAARMLTSPGRLRAFNVIMAILLVASMVPAVVE